ncbi:hypothetical protein [Aestuariivirga sp.]|uniref:hypothetical protein n=1 Tax=Aestuariivirga sp. TaxID=2650926 RepID=UPI003593EA2A
MKLQFLMCGEADDAFFSQAAMFRLALDSHGGDHAGARMTLCLGSTPLAEVPERWRRPLRNIELRWLAAGRKPGEDDLAQSMLTYESIAPDADVAIICDADTLLVRPLAEAFLREMVEAPALAGTIAHFAPPLKDTRKPPPKPIVSTAMLWEELSQRVLGRPVDMSYRYTLRRESDPPDEPCPFYINLGVVIATPAIFARFHAQHREVIPVVREVLENRFYEQISVPFAAARAGVPQRVLPMRFNFPNDPLAEVAYPDEAAAIIQLHYMRTKAFHRHRIFADRGSFETFMGLDLQGSNMVFQQAVREATDGRYPF